MRSQLPPRAKLFRGDSKHPFWPGGEPSGLFLCCKQVHRAHRTLNSRNADELAKAANSFDFILNTANANLDWNTYVAALKPKGRLHTVGAAPEPMAMVAFPMIIGQKSLSASPLGSPSTTDTMLAFSARHGIAPTTETFPMSRANDAIEHLRSGKARYRVVLTNDLV